MKVNIITLGCKVNAYESEMIKEKFIEKNYEISSNIDDSNIIVVNTCSVTNEADKKSRKIIHSVKRKNPDSIIVVCGCMAQNKMEMDDANILIGNKDKSKIVYLVEEYLKKQDKIIKFYDINDFDFEDMKIDKFGNKTRGFIKIQDGCDNYCSYCVIPYLRGHNRSKDYNTTINEANILVKNGHQEIVITGIHTGKYFNNNHDLTDVINEMSKIEDLKRIRVSSIEINELNDKFIEELKNNLKICDHLHIPLQAGSNHVLKLMNRTYNKEEFECIVKKIRKVRPDINFTTDIIVGFPNEKEDDFKETLSFSKQIGFSKIHVFPYSRRSGTKADTMEGHIGDNIKKERTNKLIELSNELENIYYERFIGKELLVLIEENYDNKSVGHTSNFIKVEVNGNIPKNTFINVKIIKVNDLKVFGKIV